MRRTALFLVLAFAAAIVTPAAAADGDLGTWSPPFAEVAQFGDRPPANGDEAKAGGPPAVGIAMMPDGRIVYWGGLTSLEDSNPGFVIDGGRAATPSPSRILDLRSGVPVFSSPGNNTGGPAEYDDFFCADMRLTHDGRIIVAGGSIWASDPDLSPIHPVTEPVFGPGFGGGTDIFGSNATRWISADTADTWVGTDENRMAEGRWYPTMTTLPDGKLHVASGVYRVVGNSEGFNVRSTETFDPATNRWTTNPASADLTLPLFPRLHLTHDGKVFYTASGQMWSPFGQSPDEALWNLQQAYDPATQAWQITGVGAFGARSSVFSVPLMMKAPYDRTEILIGGGTLGVSPSTFVATPLTEIVTYADGESSSVRAADLNNARWFSSGVLLPDGGVLAVSGGDKDEVISPGNEQAVRQAELFDGEQWIPLSLGGRDRTYHNSAILLPDATVLVGGHSPIAKGYWNYDNTTHDLGLTANNFKDPSFEIFSPPYLSRGARPQVLTAPAGLAWDSAAVITATPGIDKLVLMRLPSTTHVQDADQRGIELEFTEDLGVVQASVPDANVVPAGYYYLFALSDNGEGLTPSKAAIVKVGPTADITPATFPFGN
jgi:hypothetical protein